MVWRGVKVGGGVCVDVDVGVGVVVSHLQLHHPVIYLRVPLHILLKGRKSVMFKGSVN